MMMSVLVGGGRGQGRKQGGQQAGRRDSGADEHGIDSRVEYKGGSLAQAGRRVGVALRPCSVIGWAMGEPAERSANAITFASS
jgi:hypothetical protein